MRKIRWYAAVGGVLAAGPALSLDWTLGSFEFAMKNQLSIGAAMRMQDRSNELIGKFAVPGQQDLCTVDDCISLEGDPGPNQRLVDAEGAFFGANADDGNLNYDQYDLIAAPAKLNSDLTVRWGEWLGRLHAIGYYDMVNVDFDESHPFDRFQPRYTKRPNDIEERYASGVELYDAYLQYAFEFGERQGALTVGNQIVRWGESTLVAINSVSEINPPNANFLRMPGNEINEVFQPVPAVVLATDLIDNVSAELFYQLQWRKTQPDARGSFFSDIDLAGVDPGAPAYISLGQFGEDPDRQFRFAGPIGEISDTTVTTYIGEREARDSGQYGLRLNYFADWLNGGTELGAYFLNYHSRLPYASMYASDDSCARDANNLLAAYAACNGFRGRLNLPRLNPLAERGEPLPIDTANVFLEYPEDIQMFAMSFNTNIGSYSLAGEYSYRPNVPVQVHIPDMVLMGIQPAIPENEFAADPTGGVLNGLLDLIGSIPGVGAGGFIDGLASVAGITIPAAAAAAPSFLKDYRGIDRVEANSYIRGYERLGVGQLDLTAIRAVSSVLGADQIIFIGEVGMTHIIDMPSKRELQFETLYLNATSAKPGADGTGQPDGQPQPGTFVPTQQTKGFADDLAWGLRLLIRGEYNDVLFGWSFKPTAALSWDVQGTAPYPIQNFVEDRKEFIVGTEVNFTQSMSGRVLYQWFTGAGDRNTRRDRDNVALSFGYAF